MARMTIRTHVEAPPEVVFAAASDFRRVAEICRGIERVEVLTDGPIGVGTRFRETRKMFGKESTEELQITAFGEPHGYVVECESCGAHFRSQFSFVGDIAGTHIRVETECRPLTLLAKLMSPLSSLMMGTMKKMIAADLEELKQAVEAGQQEDSQVDA